MQRPYGLFIFSQTLPDMQGELLDRLIGKAYGRVHAHIHSAPPLIYLLRQAELPLWLELSRHARVRAHVLMPPRLDMLMRSVEGIVAAREGGPPTL